MHRIRWTETVTVSHEVVITDERLTQLRAGTGFDDLDPDDPADGLYDGLADLTVAELTPGARSVETHRDDIHVDPVAAVLHMQPATEYRETTYGVLWTSAETVYVKGRAAHNPHHPHTVDIWRDASCTGGWGTHVFNAQAVIIASTPVDRPPNVGTVREHDRVRLVFPDGHHEDHIVVAGPLRDPKLVPEESFDLPATLQVGGVYDERTIAALTD
jgi:hypothetical protein